MPKKDDNYTINICLKEGYSLLNNNFIDSALLDARILLEYVTGLTREKIIFYPEQSITQEQYKVYMSLIGRRMNYEPIAYILGKKEFWGIEFKVSKDTLIPRPDTEALIEEVLKTFPDKTTQMKLLDLGTGTGCIILSIISAYPNASGLGIDISDNAIKIAEENARNIDLKDRVIFKVGDLAENINDKFDLIISNPPYIDQVDKKNLQLDIIDYEPELALFAADNGLEFYKRIAQYKDLLKTEGCIIVEFGDNQHNEVKNIFELAGFNDFTYIYDLSGTIRGLKAKII